MGGGKGGGGMLGGGWLELVLLLFEVAGDLGES